VDWPLDRGTVPFWKAPAILTFHRSGDSLEVRSLDPVSGETLVDLLPIVDSGSGRWLADASDLLLRDAYGVSESLLWVEETGEFDSNRSSIVGSDSSPSGPSAHVDVETVFHVPGGSDWLEERSPDPETLSVIQRHVFFKTEPGFDPVPTNGRVGINGIPFVELEQSDLPGNWVPRWRALAKPDGVAGEGTLRVYLDSAIPERHRSAFQRAVGYWGRALQAVGWKGEIELLTIPTDSDPLSLEYPVVFLWMERPQPMSSMANMITDPRSGEVVKGILQVASHGVPIAVNEYRAYRPALDADAPSEAEYVEDRLAWNAAHEFGHMVAGLAHTASKPTAVGFRLPVLSSGSDGVALDLTGTLPADPFPYDLWTLGYAYPEMAHQERQGRDEYLASGGPPRFWPLPGELWRFSPDAASRVRGPDVLEELQAALEVRHHLLSAFDEAALDPGEPRAVLFERLFPVYFHHRFALDASVRMVGGVTRLPGTSELRPVPPGAQRSALDAVLDALQPAALAIPREASALIPPSASDSPALQIRGDPSDETLYSYQTGTSPPIEVPAVPGTGFEPEGWAETLTRMTLGRLLDPTQLERMAEQDAVDPAFPGADEVLGRVVDGLWAGSSQSNPDLLPYDLARKQVLLDQLIGLAFSDDVPDEIRSLARSRLGVIRARILGTRTEDAMTREFLERSLRRLDAVSG
jgi:hypothetical protein